MFCIECGKEVNVKAVVCINCGAPLNKSSNNLPAGDKEWLIAMILCWFLGILGMHRFYTGHMGIGIIQLLTLGGCGIWTLIDFIMIASGNFKDSDGQLLKK